MKKGNISMPIVMVTILLVIFSCSKNEGEDQNKYPIDLDTLPIRTGPRPETTTQVPHVQIDVELVPDVHEELFRRVYSIPGIENEISFVQPSRGLIIGEDLEKVQPKAFISDREFGHIHTDGSLHIFLEPTRASEAVETGWATFHPAGFDGFVMLYTPQSFDELNVTFRLIVDAFNYVTGQAISARDYYD